MVRPRTTYRIQLRDGVDLDAAADRLDHVAELGVSHLYLSPVLTAVPGSTHGYDVTDATSVDPALGGNAAFARFADAARARDLGIVLDLVPNHMAAHPSNPWWCDVLAHGPHSRWADHFDIDWEAARGRLVLPVLGDTLDAVAADGQVAVGRTGAGRAVLRLHDHELPLADGSLEAASVASDGVLDREQARRLVAEQHYLPIWWRDPERMRNYRRFFDINELVGVRVEDPDVFRDTHGLVLEWISDGLVDGLRLDHIDGLRAPTSYLERLRGSAGDAWIVVEKILEPGERLHPAWPVDGTVGYEFLRAAGGVQIDPAGEDPLTSLYEEFVGSESIDDVVTDKREVVEELLAADRDLIVDRLAEARPPIASSGDVRRAVTELLASFPVYRTYVEDEPIRRSASDEVAIHAALEAAVERAPELRDVLATMAEVLLLRDDRGTRVRDAAMRFQQLTGPVMAKGVEDTQLYRDLRLVALNEVGADPGTWGGTVTGLHAQNTLTVSEWPATMLTVSTHDTKRSVDVRARLAVLSEIPGEWTAAVRRWRSSAAAHRSGDAPSPNAEYLLYQTVVGAWPIGEQRLAAYLVKAAREEKRHTSWYDPDEAYEDALTAFARGVLRDDDLMADMEAFVDRVRPVGWINSLVLTLLELTSPGVPDIYQGTAAWDLSLVDPDNRRPPDTERLTALRIDALATDDPSEVMTRLDDGLPRVWLVNRTLDLRREHPESFRGSYEALEAAGERSRHVVSFLRGGEVIVVAPRLTVALGDQFGDWEWGDTVLPLPPGRWRNVLGDQEHDGQARLENLLERFPVALLLQES